ncbi:hypothetical protein KAR91_58760 [Candidatus Pacearchaeota archaeon]|nr:hypothetical protein [Candidatus Pacearchaeota archaeon]
MSNETPDNSLYAVKKNIRYKNPDKKLGMYRALITPDMDIAKNGLPFPHLSAAEKKLMVTRGYLAPKK